MIDAYDAALFDLDGVVYLGPVAVPGAAEGIADLRAREIRVGFVTNNAARPPHAVAEHLRELGIEAPGTPTWSPRLRPRPTCCGPASAPGPGCSRSAGKASADALDEAGLIGVGSADDGPAAIIQGWGGELTWNQLNEAAIAVQRGAYWVATNTDPTRPTDRGSCRATARPWPR